MARRRPKTRSCTPPFTNRRVQRKRLMASVTTTASGKAAPWWRSLNKLSQEQVVAAIVILLLIVFALALPGFATTKNILGLVRSISILGILGLGMALIVISRSID